MCSKVSKPYKQRKSAPVRQAVFLCPKFRTISCH
nr:MAG TPA: hypothetical protein [Caudoviricetes sp.]